MLPLERCSFLENPRLEFLTNEDDAVISSRQLYTQLKDHRGSRSIALIVHLFDTPSSEFILVWCRCVPSACQ